MAMRTVGQILKDERERKFYTLEEIEKVTKIRVELLQALEADNFAKLPPATFIQGFIKNYGKFLGLDTNKLLAVFRREYSERKNPPRIIESFENPLKPSRFHLTPSSAISLMVVSLVLIFFAYLWYEYRFLVLPPPLEVYNPADQANVQNASVAVAGQTDPEAKLSINNQDVGVSKDGHFDQEVKLSEGANRITITSTSKFGRSTKAERTVFLQQ